MKYIVKSIIFALIMYITLLSSEFFAIDLLIALNLIIATLLIDSKNKYIRIAALTAEVILVCLSGVFTDYVFWSMLILIFDIVYMKYYLFAIAVFIQIIYFDIYLNDIEIWPLMLITGIIAYILKLNADEKSKYHDILDNERRTKYELELAQVKLIKSNKEAEKLAEAKERNRIARDVHDNVGHSIAGILIKLQATKKVMKKDEEKGNKMLDECVVHLQDSLEVLRDTVHNMYSYEKQGIGIGYIKKIVDEYKYCDVYMQVKGQFKHCKERTFSALSYVLKEALTNTAKHSKATKVDIELLGDDVYISMVIQDNGTGCDYIKESLGIRSMRDRIRGLNGNLKIESADGMKITCEIPL